MGGKSSKSEKGLSRSFSIRKSQKSSLLKIQRKLDRVSADIHKFNGQIDDAKHTSIKTALSQIVDELDQLSSVVKTKHTDLYQDLLERCGKELEKLERKVSHARPTSANSLPPPASSPLPRIASPMSLPARSPTPSSLVSPSPRLESPFSERSDVQAVKVMIEAQKSPTPMERKPKKVEFFPADSDDEEPNAEKDAVDSIDAMRRRIELLEEQIHIFKQEGDMQHYKVIQNDLHLIISKLENMDAYGNIQIKHERKLALQRAQDCLRYLNDNSDQRARPVQQTQVIVELHQKTVTPTSEEQPEVREHRATYTRPVTLDLNVNEQLKDELREVIHKRIEEATMDDEEPNKDGTKNTTRDSSFENFVNTDSEDDFDFVCADAEDTSKSTPMLVTSL